MADRNYSDLIRLPTFEERFRYLKLCGSVGDSTFGFDRFINQQFYRSLEWKHVRDFVIVRDNGLDLGVSGHEIGGPIYVHHMNPIPPNQQFLDANILNPEFLICVSLDTHNAIHYGDESILHRDEIIIRSSNDTAPWKRK